MFQVVNQLFARVDEERTLGIEMTELKNQVNCYGDRIHTVNQIALGRTQIEEEAPVIFREVWKTPWCSMKIPGRLPTKFARLLALGDGYSLPISLSSEN